jgi:hypothetical protein
MSAENIESILNSALQGYNGDWILPLQSIRDDCHHVQDEQPQNSPHKDRIILEKKVEVDPTSDQQSGHHRCTPHEQCHPL